IGASGSTAWERCALGLPTILAVTAANQAGIAAALDQGGAALSIGSHDAPGFAQRLQAAVFRMANDAGALLAASAAAADVTDGTGTDAVCSVLFQDIMT